jgi:hypothetical protein
MFRHVKKRIHVSVKRTLETWAPQRVARVPRGAAHAIGPRRTDRRLRKAIPVEPGSNVSLAKDSNPAFKAGVSSDRQVKGCWHAALVLLAEYQGSPQVSNQPYARHSWAY